MEEKKEKKLSFVKDILQIIYYGANIAEWLINKLMEIDLSDLFNEFPF